MSVPDDLRSTHSVKTKNAMKVPRSVKRITFNPSEANPGETLYVHVPKLNKNEVLVPGSLALRFDIDLSGGHVNNFLVQNVSRALVSKMTVKFGGTTLEETVDYDIYKTFQDLFLPGEKRDNMVPEGIQSEDLSKIGSGAGDAKALGVDAEKILNGINLDHQTLTDHGIFYPQALYNDLVFEVTLAPESQVVKGSDPTKLKYKLTNIQLEYEMIHSENIAEEAKSVYTSGKEFAYDHVSRPKVVPINRGTETRINIKVNSQRSMKGILLLFVEPYTAGTRDSEKYIFPALKKNQRHGQRLAKHAVQQRHRKSGYLVRGQPLFHERKIQAPAHDSEKVLHKKQVRASDRSALHGEPRNAWQWHPARKHHRRRPAGN